MKLSKYEWKFVRMMIKMFCTIIAIIISLILIGAANMVVMVIGGVMLGISYLVKRVYWVRLEGLELKEKIDKEVNKAI